MAFQTSRSNSVSAPAAAAKPSYTKAVETKTSSTGSKSINLGGLYEGKPNSKLALKGSKTKEDIVIPAGYIIKVFVKGGQSKNGKDLPPFEVVAQPPMDAE